MKNRHWPLYVGIIVIHLVGYFIHLQITHIASDFITIASVYSLAVLLVGSFIVLFKLKPDQFVGRFMIATTVQMLAALSFILALSYKKIPDSFELALGLLVSFILGLAWQSAYLIKKVNK
jgi:hypothetical protein